MLFNIQKPFNTLLSMTSQWRLDKFSQNYRSFKAIAGHPPGSSSSRTARQHAARNAAQRTEQAAGQLSRFYHKKPMASKFAEYEPNGLSRVGCNVGALTQA